MIMLKIEHLYINKRNTTYNKQLNKMRLMLKSENSNKKLSPQFFAIL